MKARASPSTAPQRDHPPRPTPFRIGVPVSCADGACGDVVRVVIDPMARTLTHLVVAPAHRRLERLVPVELVESGGETVRLRCTVAEFEQLDVAEEVHFLPDGGEEWGYASGEALSWPFHGLSLQTLPVAGMGAGGMAAGAMSTHHVHEPIVHESVPAGEVDVRRGDRVQAKDGPIGSVEGLVVDPRDHRVTHVLLQEGHLWGRKQVAIPIRTVRRDRDVIQVDLTRQQVRDLPPVELASRP